jgi:16S rRNA (uracil1498-N3)-methyltransferase
MMQKIRLYNQNTPLSNGAEFALSEAQSHYAQHVMRLKVGAHLHLFDGVNGEWQAEIIAISKKAVNVRVIAQTYTQANSPDIWLAFAPIKAGRIEFLVEKATELGVSRLLPVKTERTILGRINVERLQAHAIEAAEQSGRVDVPQVLPYQPLEQLLYDWDNARTLIYGDESGRGQPASTLLTPLQPPLSLLIGPEGGFSPTEFALFKQFSFMHALHMGKRIMRADTAALAGLTLLQNYCGDW